MRATTLMSALLLLLISPAFAAPLVKRQGKSRSPLLTSPESTCHFGAITDLTQGG